MLNSTKIREVVLITGATGFVGKLLAQDLIDQGHTVRAAVRAPLVSSVMDCHIIGDIGPDTKWNKALSGISTVVHLAARTHVMKETTGDALAAYRRLNVLGTRSLARAAAHAGVRRLIFISSIKVNGESTVKSAFTEQSLPLPEDAYGISKWEAEQELQEVAQQTGLDIVVLRPTLVYGPGVKGNFLQLMQWIARGVPLPLASIENKRSLLYVGNLVDAIVTCISAPTAAGKTYLLSDGEDVSTPDLIRRIASAMNVRPRLIRCPSRWLLLAAKLVGKETGIRRLSGSLQADSSSIRRELVWSPHFTLADGLLHTCRWYHSEYSA
jgi:nucleoside-diphosphate-sugar epimerase